MEEFTTSAKAIWVALVSNLVLAVAKIFVGLAGNSSALIADGANSTSDSLVSIASLISLKIARQPKDKEHPYGHGKAETIAASIVGLSILAVSVGIIYSASLSLSTNNIAKPEFITAYVAFLSLAAKEWLYRYTLTQARLQHSIILHATAADHRSDQLTASTALIGIIASRMGFPLFDPVAAILIGFLITYTAYRVLKASIYQLMDGQAEDEVIGEIARAAMANEQVLKVQQVRARLIGRGIFVDLTILMNPGATLQESHAITEQIEETIKLKVPRVIGVVTHVEPYTEGR